jgi:uncharacterized membrane-anchored protein YitT (DUF2179 family)
MNVVIVCLVRFVVVIGGYIVACLGASAFLNILILGSAGLAAEELRLVASESLVVSIPLVAMLLSYVAFFPSLLAILASEFLGKRDWLFFALAGAVVAAVLIGLDGSYGDEFALDPAFLLAAIGAGMCGGIGYWAVAGRSAGSPRKDARIATSPEP